MQGRGNRGGGGEVGATFPTTLKLWGRRPPPPNVGLSISFIFILVFFHMNLDLSQTIVGQFRGVPSFV